MNTCMKCFGSMNKLGHEITCHLCKDIEIDLLNKQIENYKTSDIGYSDTIQKLTEQICGLESELTSERSKSERN